MGDIQRVNKHTKNKESHSVTSATWEAPIKNPPTINAGEGVEKRGPSYTVSGNVNWYMCCQSEHGNVNWYSHYGEHYCYCC